VEDLRALSEALGVRRFALVGHDWGGAVAWAFAIAHPDRPSAWSSSTRRIRRSSGACCARTRRSRSQRVHAGPPQREGGVDAAENDFAALKRIVLGGLLAGGKITAEDERAYVAAWSQPGALTGGLNFYRAARVGPPARDGEPASGTLGTGEGASMVRVPTLVIWGEKDTALLPQNLDGLEALRADLTIRRIPDGTHWVITSNPPS